MTTKPIGLYVHIPFCKRKCDYCDFCSYPVSEAKWKDEYIKALCSEIDSYKGLGLSLDSIFFGGGTPSLLSPKELDDILCSVRKSFNVLPCSEITMEMNPGTLTKENLRGFASLGINRASIGVQSIHENELKILGRIHNARDFYKSYELVRECGIENINLDLMYGIPEQTLSSFDKTLEAVISLSPEHLSLYGLILEEGTPFYIKRDTLNIPDEDTECDMYGLAVEKLSLAGYSHYEISNYAKPGFECRHNLKYWHDEEYIGVGVAAYSYFDKSRFGNPADIDVYLSEDREKYIQSEAVDDKNSEAYEYAMLRLRLSEGFSLSDYRLKFGFDFITEERSELIDNYVKLGMIELSDDNIHLTDKGFYISNRILTDLL